MCETVDVFVFYFIWNVNGDVMMFLSGAEEVF